MKLDELKKIAALLPDPGSPDAKEQVYALLRSFGLDSGNIYQELEMGSRYVDTHRDTSFSNAQMQLHSHIFMSCSTAAAAAVPTIWWVQSATVCSVEILFLFPRV